MNTKSKRKEKLFSYYSVLLVFILLASIYFSNTILLYILIAATAILIFNPVYILPVYIISSLSSDYFVAGEGLGISRLIGFVIIAGGFIYQARHNYPIRKKESLFLVFILIFAFFSSSFSLTGSLQPFISLTQNVLIIFFISRFRQVNIKSFSKILILSAIITTIFFAITLKDTISSIEMQRLTTGDNLNENRFAMMLAQLIAIITAGFFIYKEKKIYQLTILAVIFVGFFLLILSGSRSATIGIVGAIVVVLLYQFKNNSKKIIIPLLLLSIASFFFIDQIQDMDNPIINRFTIDSLTESGGTGRLDIWKALIPATFENSMLFGYGLGGANAYALAYKYGLSHAAHNFLIDMFIQTGLVGVFLFFSYFIFVGKKLVSALYNPYIFIPLLILLTGLINGIGETVYLEKFFWNGIALGWLYLNNLANTGFQYSFDDNKK